MENKLPNDMTNEEIIESYERLLAEAEENAGALSECRDILKERLKEKNLKSSIIGDYTVSVYSATRFTTTVDQARELGATEEVTEEIIVKSKLKILSDAGVKVPGKEVSENIRISKTKV